MVKVKFISLVNLIMDNEVIKELIQDDCTATNISKELKVLIEDGVDYATLRDKLGDKVASEETAKLIIEHTTS